MTPELCFVVGIGRSGTTALWDVLSSHQQIVLGCERYKRLWGARLDELRPELFTDKSRFFDFSDELTNLTPEDRRFTGKYAEMQERFDSARYVGDKMTEVKLGGMRENFPKARHIGIVRNVEPTAASWSVRAQDPTDAWPARNDARAAVDYWNAGTRRLVRNRRRFPDRVQLVEYESFFSDPDARVLLALLSWLDLEPDDAVMRAFDRVHRRYLEEIRGKERGLPSEVRDYIAERHDEALWRRAKRLSI